MSRAGRSSRGGGAGGRRTGPDLSWEDEPIIVDKKKPGPLFPDLNPPLSVPKPVTSDEKSRVDAYLSFRDAMRNSKIYAILGTNAFTDANGKLNKRAGFDPFTGMEKYSARFDKPTRTAPDLSGRTYYLPFFPREMWPLLDPERKSSAWPKRSVRPSTHDHEQRHGSPSTSRKRKRPLTALPAPSIDGSSSDSGDGGAGSEEESDAPISSSRKKQRKKATSSSRKRLRKTTTTADHDQEKSGLEAEDDIPDADHMLSTGAAAGDDDEDGMGGGDAGSELSDAVFSDDEGGDYAAEGYFDDGMGDDGFGDDGDGGGGEGTFD